MCVQNVPWCAMPVADIFKLLDCDNKQLCFMFTKTLRALDFKQTKF